MSEADINIDVPLTVLLAGGFGTRVSHLLPGVPKPMAEIEGLPYLEWIIRYYRRCGAKRFVLSTGHLSEVIERYFAGSGVTCRKEENPLGTAGGFLNAISGQAINEAGCLVANGDSLVVSDPLQLARLAINSCWEDRVSGPAVCGVRHKNCGVRHRRRADVSAMAMIGGNPARIHR